MKSIYKYPLKIIDAQTIQIPSDSKVISAADQNGILCIWAEVDEARPIVGRVIRIFGTGNPRHGECNVQFIDSVIMGEFVWHVYVDLF